MSHGSVLATRWKHTGALDVCGNFVYKKSVLNVIFVAFTVYVSVKPIDTMTECMTVMSFF